MPPTYLLIYLILSLILHFLIPLWKFTYPIRYVGLIFVVIGIALNLWTDSLFAKAKTTVKPNEKPNKFITTGPFKYSRNPMYLGIILILMGISITLGSLSSLLGPVLMLFTLQVVFIPHEESQMEKQFGKKYLEYKQQVRRWI